MRKGLLGETKTLSGLSSRVLRFLKGFMSLTQTSMFPCGVFSQSDSCYQHLLLFRARKSFGKLHGRDSPAVHNPGRSKHQNRLLGSEILRSLILKQMFSAHGTRLARGLRGDDHLRFLCRWMRRDRPRCTLVSKMVKMKIRTMDDLSICR